MWCDRFLNLNWPNIKSNKYVLLRMKRFLYSKHKRKFNVIESYSKNRMSRKSKHEMKSLGNPLENFFEFYNWKLASIDVYVS